MNNITLETLYKVITTTEISTLIQYYFFIYISITLIQAFMKTKVTILDLKVNRKILLGALVSYLIILLTPLAEDHYDKISDFGNINILYLLIYTLLTISVVQIIIKYLITPVIVFFTCILTARRVRERTQASLKLNWQKILDTTQEYSNQEDVVTYFRHRTYDVLMIVAFLSYTLSNGSGNIFLLSIVISIYYLIISFNSINTNWKDSGSLSNIHQIELLLSNK